MNFDIHNAQVLGRDGLGNTALSIKDGLISAVPTDHAVDLEGFVVLPGIVDIHGDGFERHLAPRRGAMKDLEAGLVAAEAEISANGITTAVLAQFYSWEGGLRGPEFAERVFTALNRARRTVTADLLPQLRFETHMLDDYAAVKALIKEQNIGYVVFNDHLPHDRLAAGRVPKRLTGQALKSGRSPETLLELMKTMHRQSVRVPKALDGLCGELASRGVTMGSHDDATDAAREAWNKRGVRIAEFPETQQAVQAARDCGDGIVLGAPNVARGGSHNGNVSAADMVAMGLCDALASDYHYPSMRRAVFLLADAGVLDLSSAWGLISSGPARLLGLTDRGELSVGKRADLVILDAKSRKLCATIRGGRFSYLSGELADRFFRQA